MQGCVVAKCTITLDPNISVGYVHAAVAFCTDGRRPRCQFHANKPVFGFLRQLTAWHCPHLLLRAVLRRGWLLSAGRQSVDISCSPGPQQQTRSSGVRRTTDRRTDTVPWHRPCCAYYHHRRQFNSTNAARTIKYMINTHSVAWLAAWRSG